MSKQEVELLVEIFEGEAEWGRDSYVQSVQAKGHLIRVLCLGDARPPSQIDSKDETWLDPRFHAAFANAKLREMYPQFLHEFSKSTGLLDITVLQNSASLFWFLPISEMSLMRNPLIDKLYALLVLEQELLSHPYSILTFASDDPLLMQPISDLAMRYGVKLEKIDSSSHPHSVYKNKAGLILQWWGGGIRDLAYWILFRLLNWGGTRDLSGSNSRAVGLTIYPTLWEQTASSGELQNRALGDWPDILRQHDMETVYAAIPSMRLKNFFRDYFKGRADTKKNSVIFIHSLVKLFDVFSIYLRLGWGRKLAKWLGLLRASPVMFNNINISALLHREMLQEIWSPSIIQCLMVAQASACLIKQLSLISCSFYPFEFQPIEKAFTVGSKLADKKLPVLGLQTSIIGRAHLGYQFMHQQVGVIGEILPPFAPLPDYVASYGTITHAALTERLGSDRVVLTGPIRYPYLRIDSAEDRAVAKLEWKDRLKLDHGTMLVLLALPSIKQEAQTILDWAIDIGKEFPQIFFLVRFHYWVPLADDMRRRAEKARFDRYHIPSSGLHELLLASQVIVTGTSSVGVEGMISGCMPVCYQTTGRYDFGRVQDVAEGAYFFSSKLELQQVMEKCLACEKDYEMRRAQWPLLIERLVYGLDGKSGARFYDWLKSQKVLN